MIQQTQKQPGKILIALDKGWDGEKILEYAEQFRWENIAKDTMLICKNIMGGD